MDGRAPPLTYWPQMRQARIMFRRAQVEIPIDLRERLEAARLDLLALFRAVDRMHLAPQQIPQRLIRQLFELDADYVEALWALDQPPGTINPQAMLRDTLAALEQLPTACSRFRKTLPSTAKPTLSQLELTIRVNLSPTEAYSPAILSVAITSIVTYMKMLLALYGPGSGPPERLSTLTRRPKGIRIRVSA